MGCGNTQYRLFLIPDRSLNTHGGLHPFALAFELLENSLSGSHRIMRVSRAESTGSTIYTRRG